MSILLLISPRFSCLTNIRRSIRLTTIRHPSDNFINSKSSLSNEYVHATRSTPQPADRIWPVPADPDHHFGGLLQQHREPFGKCPAGGSYRFGDQPPGIRRFHVEGRRDG